ncbi:hypothetical protein F8388_000708 [Cannabis sativa]|uniref:RNase H type-1 domain-containing protein n=1 Tax=Cannabis sativa TaxID=3483 RepID=A0A7J6ED72_CANSA|nr:hypothetical protein F8388_000708 [Cannabis sativa]KAF4357789.1 hypothetical protein G4B88_025024 [Cannabis sativa]
MAIRMSIWGFYPWVGLSSLRWVLPPSGRLKLNVYAGLRTIDRMFGCGVVVRDHLGAGLALSTSLFVGSPSPSIIEALAFLNGLMLCVRMVYNNIEVESNC